MTTFPPADNYQARGDDMSSRKCLALACSPRRGGNTRLLAQRALEGAAQAGAETELVLLADHNCGPCRGCGGCDKTGRCVVLDDTAAIYDKILAADGLILAAPIFSMGMNAQGKAFVDRAQKFWAAKYLLGRQVIASEEKRLARRGIFISAAGTGLPGVFDGAVRVARYFFKMLDISYAGAYCYPKTDGRGEILSNREALAEVLGAGLALGQNSPKEL
jgi:hypothetical protein